MWQDDPGRVAEEVDSTEASVLKALCEAESLGIVADDDACITNNLAGDIDQVEACEPIDDDNVKRWTIHILEPILNFLAQSPLEASDTR